MRASSAIDAEAQRRAKARANYGALVQQKINKIALSKLFMIKHFVEFFFFFLLFQLDHLKNYQMKLQRD